MYSLAKGKAAAERADNVNSCGYCRRITGAEQGDGWRQIDYRAATPMDAKLARDLCGKITRQTTSEHPTRLGV